ncbi:MAG: hypothetical protein DMD61_05460 [Gemmatimonadetes bacterium]|nr:MAG: hypothetical protein DMD61_05460 [Gemmatimonadota bacterium]
MRALPAPLPPVPGLPRFTGGAVGYLGYDLVRTVERLPHAPADTLGVPDAIMMIADTLVILDNLFGRAIVVANVEVAPGAPPAERLRLYDAAVARVDDMVERLGQQHNLAPLALRNGLPSPPLATDSRYPRAAFERDVARVLEYVGAGDTFQTVLSRRQEAAGAVDPLLLYRYLRALNPAPYLYYLGLDDFALVGSSPEVLVRVTGDEVTVRPIAGTAHRGRTPETDDILAKALREDAKEVAEHRMLVDLGRNDVGRVAVYGSVRVTELLAVERYSHVQHLVPMRAPWDTSDGARATSTPPSPFAARWCGRTGWWCRPVLGSWPTLIRRASSTRRRQRPRPCSAPSHWRRRVTNEVSPASIFSACV